MPWRLPDGTSGLEGRGTDTLPLYGVHLLDTWPKGQPIAFVEGEKCAQALIDAGIPAVGSVTGASGRPSDDVLADLAGQIVSAWPDADPDR
jgi:DNA primase